MSLRDVTGTAFQQEVVEAKGLVVVDYWADWCAPCKQMAPILEELEAAHPDIKFVKVDTDAETALAAQRGIMGLPTLEFWVDGEVVDTATGGKTKRALQKAIDEHAPRG